MTANRLKDGQREKREEETGREERHQHREFGENACGNSSCGSRINFNTDWG